MTPRPIHRWKSFWLGILVLIFLAWAWGASIGRMSELRLSTPYRSRIALVQFDGEAAIFQIGSSASDSWRFSTSDQPGMSDPAFKESWRQVISANGFLLVTHAQLIIAFLLLWSTFLLWRRHRMRHLLLDPSSPIHTTP